MSRVWAGLERRVQLSRKKGLRHTSRKREREMAQREKVREVVLARDGGCLVRYAQDVLGPCGGRIDTHEPKSRARGGDELDPEQCIALCRNHHEFAHSEDCRAYQWGLIKHSWEAT